MDAPIVFERDDFLYIVGSVAPITPGADEVAAFAFAQELRTAAPNDSLLWLRGQYVEADSPNRNGQYWGAKELAIKSLTPRFMPITVMHDPKTAVGLIADTKLLLPDSDDVPRSRIDTALAIWAHRFPEVAEECQANYAQGTLMQSMECTISHYDCIECGKAYVKLPGNAERANWCDHLRSGAESGVPVRRLQGVNFTGTGLIFGTRNGATGANAQAHLESFQSEVAEFHERAHAPQRKTRSRRKSVDIEKSEYDELVAAKARVTVLEAENASLKAEANKVPDLEKDLEAAQIAQKAAETERDTEKSAREALEETARAATLADERVGKLGGGFLAKLPDEIQTKLGEQAKTLSDEDWTARLDELTLMTGVKSDEGAPAESAGTVTETETARTQLGGSAAPAVAPSRAATETVLGGLLRSVRNKPASK